MAAAKGNKYAVGNKGGRPPVFKDAKALAKAVDTYFVYIEGEFHIEKRVVKDPETKKRKMTDVKVWDRYPEPATITGLVLYLGFAHRQSLEDYEKKKEFSDIIKRARTRVEHEYEKRLHGDKNTGAIFALKNMGWIDKQIAELSGKDGQPIQTHNLTDLTYEQLYQLKYGRPPAT